MDQLQRALQILTEAEQNLENVVAAERAMGRSWAHIGDRLGVTRQAAFKRFGRVTDTLTGETMTARDITHLGALTESFFASVARGDEALAMGMIHPAVRRELPWDVITETWKRALTEYGALERFTGTFVTHPGGTQELDAFASPDRDKVLGIAVGVTTLNQEAGEIMGRVAFDQDDAIVGLLYLPVDAAADVLPF